MAYVPGCSMLAQCWCCMGRRKSSLSSTAEGLQEKWHPQHMRSLLLYTTDMEAALQEINSKGGHVAHKLSRIVLVALLPESFDAGLLRMSTTSSPPKKSLDDISKRMVRAWAAVKLKQQDTVDRPLPLKKYGSIAVALLMVSGEPSDLQISDEEQVLSAVLEGAQSLVLSQPSAKLSFTFEHLSVRISPSENVPNTNINAWPSGVVFQDKLYCFHQGAYRHREEAMYNVFDGSSWGGDTEVPNTTIIDGPSTAVFKDKLYCTHQGSNHEVWWNVFDGNSWEGDKLVFNTRITGGLSMVVFNDKLYCFHQGWTHQDNELWYNVFDGSSWEGDKLVEDTLISGTPSAVLFDDLIYCFYQGAHENENALLMNVLDPLTREWSGHSKVPFTLCMSEGPSAVVFEKKIYVFYQSAGDGGRLWFNTTSDGVVWRGDTPVAEVRMTAGPGVTVFNGELYCFYQGAGDSGLNKLFYRSFDSSGLDWENLWATPALQQLGYSSAYKGFGDLAEEIRSKSNAKYGYVACVTPFPLLYGAYADATRLCIQYPHDDISTTFAQIFDSNGTYDESSDTGTEPRYTFAQSSALNNQVPISLYATTLVFHQGEVGNSGKQLWFSFLDRRTSRWAEMQGPKSSASSSGVSALFHDSNLYVFYTADSGSLSYNVLKGASWEKEQVVSTIGSTGTPSIVIFNKKLFCFHQGSDANGELRYNVLDIESNTWEGDVLVLDSKISSGPSAVVFNDKLYCFYRVQLPTNGALHYNVFDGSKWSGDVKVFNTYITGDPSAVVYEEKIYCIHQGGKGNASFWYNVFDGDSWAGDVVEASVQVLPSDGPSATVSNGALYCFFRRKGYSVRQQIWYIVLNGSEVGWETQHVLTTASGAVTQPGAMSIDPSLVAWDFCPAAV